MGLLTLPVAPVPVVIWVAEKLNDAAEREKNGCSPGYMLDNGPTPNDRR
ncbi:gas vesicle protein GvpG [Streptomyces atratus]|nr:hypothetical protein [Streptomyces atratus]MCX5345427.1 gas vesicle protein GvpG [Streptomyces atratus]